MKRKIVTLLLVIAIATISITACGNQATGTTEIAETTETIETETMATEIVETETTESIAEKTETTEAASEIEMAEFTEIETETTEQTSSVNSTSDNVILSDDEYKGDDPRDTGTNDTAKTTETTELEGVDLDGDGKISQSEADFYKELYEEVSAIVDKELGSGSTSNNSSIHDSGNLVGSGVVDGTIEGSTGSAPGQGDYTGGEGGHIY